MRLHEHISKELFSSYAIKIPIGHKCHNIDELHSYINDINFPVMLKPQLLIGGRGKAGIIKKALDSTQLIQEFTKLLNTEVKGSKPTSILIEDFIDHETEFYLSITLDRGRRSFVIIISSEGGVEIEKMGDKIIEVIDYNNFTKKNCEILVRKLNVNELYLSDLSEILYNVFNLFIDKDAELVEINPLAQLKTGEFVALDAKIIVDDNALFRHPEFKKEFESSYEEESEKQGFAFVELDGNIAVIGNGAGLVLSTLDLAVEKNLQPACFLDLGGGASFDRIYSAISLINNFDKADKILLNIFGGITSCRDVANAIIKAKNDGNLTKPLFSRISGSEEKEAKNILSKINLKIYDDVDNALNDVDKYL